MGVKKIFWNSEELRVKAGWRILAQLLLVAVFTIIFGFVDKQLVDYLPGNPSTVNFTFFQPIEVLLAIFLSMYICARYLDKRPFSDFGFVINKKWTADFFAGISLGIILMSLIFLFELSFGWIEITEYYKSWSTNYDFAYGFFYGIVMFLCVGFYEEIQVRGYLLKNLAEGFNFNNSKRAIVIALVISSFIFGFGHASNPNATLISSLSITLAGLFLAAGYLLTGRLAIPIGLHISWNFFQGYIFGFPVSGNPNISAVIAIQQKGPDAWTGGAFGPEAGLIGIFAMLLGIALTLLWVKLIERRIALKNEIAEYSINKSEKIENELVAE